MAKKLDNAGRVTIPRELRRALHWMDGDLIDIQQKGNSLILTKNSPETAETLKTEFRFFQEWAEETGTTIPQDLTEEFYSLVDRIQELEK